MITVGLNKDDKLAAQRFSIIEEKIPKKFKYFKAYYLYLDTIHPFSTVKVTRDLTIEQEYLFL